MKTTTITEQEYRELRKKLVEATAEYDLILKILHHQLPEDGSSIEVPLEVIENTDITVGIKVDRDRRVVEVKRMNKTKDPGPLFVQQLSFPFEEV